MKKAVFIVGPTASGKSGLGLKLAQEWGGAILSADSMQIYREMNVGTAKPTDAERRLVPHEMIDIRSVEEPFSVYDFKKEADAALSRIYAAGKTPFVVGGTGLYVDAILNNTEFGEMETDPSIREALEKEAEEGRAALLLERLREVDPETAAPLHEKDVKRIVRALEVYESTGLTLSGFKEASHRKKPDFRSLILYLCYHDRAALYERINRRVDQMMENGLLDETKRLLEAGAFASKTASQAIGYKELLPVITEGAPLSDAVELLKQRTRNYAKRQITWFNRYDAIRLEMDLDPDPVKTAGNAVAAFLNG